MIDAALHIDNACVFMIQWLIIFHASSLGARKKYACFVCSLDPVSLCLYLSLL